MRCETKHTQEERTFQVQNSKAFLDRRQSETAERLDPSWQPVRDTPVLEGGNIIYEVAGRAKGIICGGLGLLQEVVKAAGLRSAIDGTLELLARRKPYHESDHVLSLVFNILANGKTIDDLERQRQNVAFLDALGARRIPGPSTAGDFLRRFDAEKVDDLMSAMRQASANVWRTLPKKERRLATIDVDGTVVDTTGECKEKMDMAYNGRWGFGPLLVSLANTQEVLSVVNRPASRPSHDGAAPRLDQAIKWAKEEAGFQKVRLRGDTDFALTQNFDRWHEQDVEFVFGMDANPSFVQRAKALSDDAWKPLRRRAKRKSKKTRTRPENVKQKVVEEKGFKTLCLTAEHVAEIEYSPSKCKLPYRLVIVRKTIRVAQGQQTLEPETRYFFYITNLPAARNPSQIVQESNARCHQENLIEQLKNGVQATRMPVREFDANWAYLVIGALAWNIKAWAALLLPKSLGARALLKMEFRRFLDEIVLIPAQILTHGRRLIFRLLAVNRWTELLLEGTSHLKRRFA